MTNNKSIHDIIHDKYSRILKRYEHKLSKSYEFGENFKIDLGESVLYCCKDDEALAISEVFISLNIGLKIFFHKNGKIKLFGKKVNGVDDGDSFIFNEDGEMIKAWRIRKGLVEEVVENKVSLEKLNLDEWFLSTCESEKNVEIETNNLEVVFSFKGKLHLVKIDDLYEFLTKKCSEELTKTNIDGLSKGEFIFKTDCYIVTYSVLNNKICSRSEHAFWLQNSNEIRFDDAGYITKISCGTGQDAHRDCFWFEHGKLVKMQRLFEGKIVGTKLFNQPEKNVKAEYDVLKNKLVEAYQAGSELESKTKEASKRIELEVKKLHEAKDENSELKKSIAKEIEELRSKCNHKFEYYGSDSHRDYECCIFCELTR